MARFVIADSSAIVAAISERDEFHGWAASRFQGLPPGALVCDAVISECCFLLQREPRALESRYRLIERGLVTVAFNSSDSIEEILWLMRKYASVPMSFADACLVRMSEQHRDCVQFTADSDFRTHRRHGRQAIPLIAP
jgi:predicted nucleic acid-binding protein